MKIVIATQSISSFAYWTRWRVDPMLSSPLTNGNESDAEIALPALRERGLTAQFFPLAGRLTQPGSLKREHLRSLRDAGIAMAVMACITFLGGSCRLRSTGELVAARDQLVEASEGPINEAALPLGRYDRSVLRALRRLGYEKVFSSDRAPAWSQAWLQPRYSIQSDDTVDTVRTIYSRTFGPRVVDDSYQDSDQTIPIRDFSGGAGKGSLTSLREPISYRARRKLGARGLYLSMRSFFGPGGSTTAGIDGAIRGSARETDNHATAIGERSRKVS